MGHPQYRKLENFVRLHLTLIFLQVLHYTHARFRVTGEQYNDETACKRFDIFLRNYRNDASPSTQEARKLNSSAFGCNFCEVKTKLQILATTCIECLSKLSTYPIASLMQGFTSSWFHYLFKYFPFFHLLGSLLPVFDGSTTTWSWGCSSRARWYREDRDD